MRNIVENIIIKILKESDEEYTFLKKIEKENPNLYNRFYSLVKNRGLEYSKEKYKEYDPELIKQKEREEKKLNKKISKIEKDAKAYSELNKLIQVINDVRRDHNIGKEIITLFKENFHKEPYVVFNKYNTIDYLNKLYKSDPNRLKDYFEYDFKFLIDEIVLKNKTNKIYGDNNESIIIKRYLIPSKIDFEYDLIFSFGDNHTGNKIEDKLINKLLKEWNDLKLEDINFEIIMKYIEEFIEDLSKKNINNMKQKIISKYN